MSRAVSRAISSSSSVGTARDQLGHDLLANLGVGTVEDSQDVGPADDPDQPASLVDHGEALDLAVVHELGRVLHCVVRADRHGRARHQVGRGDAARLGPCGAVNQAGQQSPDAAGFTQHGLLDQQVRLGHHTGHLAVLVDDRERADPALAEPGGYLPERRGLAHPYRKHGHDVLDGLHLITLPLVPYAPSIVRVWPERQGRWSARAGPKVALRPRPRWRPPGRSGGRTSRRPGPSPG
jgi:hypothetical protein